MSAVLPLPARMDSAVAAGLADILRAHLGQPVILDGREVVHLGGLCLQVLLSFARSCRDTGTPVQVRAPSPALTAALADYGLQDSGLDVPAEGTQ